MKASCRRLSKQRGQTMVLGVLTLFILAVVVMITFNVTVAVHQKIKIQNHADATAYSLAVQEARALNYFAYTNRAIASAYVGMANLHAYMSEAAMLADIKFSAAQVMTIIAAEEFAQSFCGKIPCCKFQHCVHMIEAEINAVMLGIDYLTGQQGRRIQQLDRPANTVMTALNAHIEVLRMSQIEVQGTMALALAQAEVGTLLDENLQGAKTVANVAKNEGMYTAAQNLLEWQGLFYSQTQQKQRIMTEVVNATRHPFTWNRHGTPAIQLVLFPSPMLARQIKTRGWIGPNGYWMITQSPDMGFMSGGRTAFTSNGFGGLGAFTRDIDPSTPTGRTLASFDWGTSLFGQWRHGVGLSIPFPLGAPAFPAELYTGATNRHRAGLSFFNSPHRSVNHSRPRLELDRFMEYQIETRAPYNQPMTYAAASTDARVTEHGIRGPWEIARDGSGTISMDMRGGGVGTLKLTNNERANAISKGMVYYHRIGDWSDYPNLFNPYWRAKLHPMNLTEVAAVIGPFDPSAAAITAGMGAIPGDVAAGANVAR